MGKKFRPLKRITRTKIVQTLLGRLLALYIRLVFKTSKWDYQGWKKEYQDDNFPFLIVFWHGRGLSDTFIFLTKRIKQTVSVLVSRHRDGRIMASAMDGIGINTIDGSSKKGGAVSALEILRKLKEGNNIIALAPEGRKPAYKMTEGIITLAKKSQKPIVLSAFSVKKGKILRSWDRFLLPVPFNKGVVFFSEPIYIPKVLTPEEIEIWRQKLEDELLEITRKADEYIDFNHTKSLWEGGKIK